MTSEEILDAAQGDFDMAMDLLDLFTSAFPSTEEPGQETSPTLASTN